MPLVQAQTLIDARWIIPIEPHATILSDHTIVITGDLITAILPTQEAHAQYQAAQHYALSDHVLIPGLVNLHTHAAMTLMRGYADDLRLMDWLNNYIWPAEKRHVSPEFVKDGSLLACAEMLRGGITCFNDMYFYPEAAIQAALSAKMRATVGLIVIEFPTAYASDAQDYLNKGLALRDVYRSEPLIKTCLAPHAPYTISDKTFEKIFTYAEQLDIGVETHLHETEDELKQSVQEYGVRPLERLRALGLLGPNFIAIHAVHMKPDELEKLATGCCHVAHCPTSNLKLASGIAPIGHMQQTEINIGLGSDGTASNNRLDILSEMRLCALLAKQQMHDAAIINAFDVLKMATLNGAKALGLQNQIGSLKAGKAADIAAINLSGIETAPHYDIASSLVYAAGREHVSHVWVAGQLLLDNRTLTTLDESELLAKAEFWRTQLTTV